jgi:hypothetical protein
MRIGFIDRAGKLVIDFDRLPETTLAVGEFYEGRAVIYVRKDKNNESRGSTNQIAGYIDKTGAMVITPRFDSARDFSEGLAYVEAQGFKGFIDREGKPVIKIDDDLTARDFHEGLAAIGGRNPYSPQYWGYIDRTGKLVVERKYQFADDFSEGMAGVAVERKYGFINRAGELVITPRFEVRNGRMYSYLLASAGRFSEGLACVKVYESDMYGYIDKKGEFVIPPRFSNAQEFSEGLAWVVEGGISGVAPKVGWIDKSGQRVVTKVDGREFSTYPDAHYYTSPSLDWRYSEGLVPFFAIVENKPLWGYMDRNGKVVIKPILVYYEAKRVWAAGLPPEGKIVIEPKGHRVNPFLGGIARIDFYTSVTEPDYGYIDKQGRFIWRSK